MQEALRELGSLVGQYCMTCRVTGRRSIPAQHSTLDCVLGVPKNVDKSAFERLYASVYKGGAAHGRRELASRCTCPEDYG